MLQKPTSRSNQNPNDLQNNKFALKCIIIWQNKILTNVVNALKMKVENKRKHEFCWIVFVLNNRVGLEKKERCSKLIMVIDFFILNIEVPLKTSKKCWNQYGLLIKNIYGFGLPFKTNSLEHLESFDFKLNSSLFMLWIFAAMFV